MSAVSPIAYSGLRAIHLEVTSHCNLACPMCARNVAGGRVSPNLTPSHMSLDRFAEIFEPALLARLDELLLCGNYGDPAVAPDTLPILAHARAAAPRAELVVHTHGSARDPRWWAQLAELGVRCVFGIDGLEDTLAIYRRGARWEAVMANARAFIGAGGQAHWRFLVFQHNQHQVDAARALASEMGFQRFKVKATHRFYKGSYVPRGPDGRPDPTRAPRFPILDAAGVEVGALLPADAEGLVNPGFEVALAAGGGSGFRRLREGGAVACKALDPASVYVSADGLVFPCCWLGNIRAATVTAAHPVLRLAAETGGLEALRVPPRTLEEVVEGPFFARVAASWACPSVAEGRLATCANVCGGGRPLRG
ncbi:MAG: radical SAM protein [Deltaproteobacteria bacterium]|nr:radical SAM protein [Deltaproteobacteria bacterium]